MAQYYNYENDGDIITHSVVASVQIHVSGKLVRTLVDEVEELASSSVGSKLSRSSSEPAAPGGPSTRSSHTGYFHQSSAYLQVHISESCQHNHKKLYLAFN